MEREKNGRMVREKERKEGLGLRKGTESGDG